MSQNLPHFHFSREKSLLMASFDNLLSDLPTDAKLLIGRFSHPHQSTRIAQMDTDFYAGIQQEVKVRSMEKFKFTTERDIDYVMAYDILSAIDSSKKLGDGENEQDPMRIFLQRMEAEMRGDTKEDNELLKSKSRDIAKKINESDSLSLPMLLTTIQSLTEHHVCSEFAEFLVTMMRKMKSEDIIYQLAESIVTTKLFRSSMHKLNYMNIINVLGKVPHV